MSFVFRKTRNRFRAWMRHFRRTHYRRLIWRLASWEAIRLERRDRLENPSFYRPT